jgi:anti-sigma-K factor RskA
MIAHDDDFQDLVAALALGALPEAEARRVAAHLQTCDDCRALYADLRPAADLVGYASESSGLDEITSARMKTRLMRAVRADLGEPAARRRRAPSAGWLAAAAAVILAVAIGSDDLAMRDRNASERRDAEGRLAALLAPGGRHFSVPQGEVVTNGDRVFVALKLAALPEGKVYQLWTLAKGAKAVAPSITFSPEPSGVAIVELPVGASGLAAVAVSVEPAGGSKTPTSAPTFVRKLS